MERGTELHRASSFATALPLSMMEAASLMPSAMVEARPATISAAPRREDHVALGPLLPARISPHLDGRQLKRSSPGQFLQPARCSRIPPGLRYTLLTAPFASSETLVAPVTVSSSRLPSPQTTRARREPSRPSTFGQEFGEPGVKDTEDLDIGPGRIGQRAEDIEDGADADLAARADGVLHRAMQGGREEKTDADLADGPADLAA